MSPTKQCDHMLKTLLQVEADFEDGGYLPDFAHETMLDAIAFLGLDWMIDLSTEGRLLLKTDIRKLMLEQCININYQWHQKHQPQVFEFESDGLFDAIACRSTVHATALAKKLGGSTVHWALRDEVISSLIRMSSLETDQ